MRKNNTKNRERGGAQSLLGEVVPSHRPPPHTFTQFLELHARAHFQFFSSAGSVFEQLIKSRKNELCRKNFNSVIQASERVLWYEANKSIVNSPIWDTSLCNF